MDLRRILVKALVFSGLTKPNKILVLSVSDFLSGAEQSLIDLVKIANPKFEYIITIPKKAKYKTVFKGTKTYQIHLYWFYKTLNPFRYLQFLHSIICSTVKLIKIVGKDKIQVIYVNTIKALLYGLIVNCFTGKKIILHMRDNINISFLSIILLRKCNRIICVSEHISKLLPSAINNKHVIYGGIDTSEWLVPLYNKKTQKENTEEKIIIACIAQLTSWKNHLDFIQVAKIINTNHDNVCFWIVGDDLSGRDGKYKKKLFDLTKQLKLESHLHFLGYRSDIKEIMSQIDIMVHPAINEPFGRVIIEAMAMEMPVITYNCGGPAEIVLDGETGFLVEPCNYQELAKKTMELIDNKKIRTGMGKAGRQRVVEKFNIERYVRELEAIFDNVMEH